MAGKKIIYHCYGGAHSSVAAAAIHLGELSPDKAPTGQELLALTLFDRQTQEGHGQLHFFGVDEWDNQIYSVGCRNAGKSYEAVLKGVADLLQIGEELLFVDTLHCVNMKMRVGGYLSRRLGLIPLGRPIVVRGTQEAYPQLVQLVENVKADVSA